MVTPALRVSKTGWFAAWAAWSVGSCVNLLSWKWKS